MIRYGVVGCGAIHGVHCEALQNISGAQLVGIYDIVPGKATKTAEKFNVPATSSLEELLAKVDAITVCTPSGLHAQVGLIAALAGKHVLVSRARPFRLGGSVHSATGGWR